MAYSDLPTRALALQGQVYAQEIITPSQYKAGRLDLGFVLIYLFPLLLGILTVTSLSEERQANRWRMFCALARTGANFIWHRLILCTALVSALAFAVITSAVIWLVFDFDINYLYLVIMTLVYLVFWAFVAALIITLGKNSVFNSLCFVAVWLLLNVLFPAGIQLYLDNSHQEHPALKATLTQRMVMNQGWDNDPTLAFSEFIKEYPQYKDFKLPDKKGSWPWYYAQQHISDLAVEKDWQQYQAQNQQQLSLLNKLSWLSPALLLQLEFNNLAGSSAQAHFDYIQQVANYHQAIREHLYSHMYQKNVMEPESLLNFPRFKTSNNLSPSWQGLIPMLLIITILMLTFGQRHKKLNQMI